MTINVPDFENISSFDTWVENLKDKEIQSWTTKDWNKMYQKLDIFVQTSSEITELELKKLTTSQATELLEQYKQAYIDHNAEKKAIILYNRRKHFMEKCSPNSFSKLYANYRFEKNDFDKLIKHGQEIGHKLAQQTNNNSNIIDNASNHITSASKHAYQEQTAILADKIVFSTTNIGQNDYDPITGAPLNKYDDFKTYIEVNDTCEYGGGLFCSEKNTTTINGTNKDSLLESSIHEAIHAQAQLNKEYQLQNKKAHILPKNDMSEDF